MPEPGLRDAATHYTSSPEERADSLLSILVTRSDIKDEIIDSIRAAIAEEREACAKLVEAHMIMGQEHVAPQIAAAIRARP